MCELDRKRAAGLRFWLKIEFESEIRAKRFFEEVP